MIVVVVSNVTLMVALKVRRVRSRISGELLLATLRRHTNNFGVISRTAVSSVMNATASIINRVTKICFVRSPG